MTIDAGGKVTAVVSGESVVASTDAGRNAKTSNRTLSGSTDTSDMTYKNLVIPQGFVPVEVTGASWSYTDTTTLEEVSGWNSGLVIKDDANNEFVWVPCTTETVTNSSPKKGIKRT